MVGDYFLSLYYQLIKNKKTMLYPESQMYGKSFLERQEEYYSSVQTTESKQYRVINDTLVELFKNNTFLTNQLSITEMRLEILQTYAFLSKDLQLPFDVIAGMARHYAENCDINNVTVSEFKLFKM